MEPTITVYGTWSGGRFMHFGEELDEERYLATLRHAFDKGIRTFMTADAYGAGEADTLLGKALSGIPRDQYSLIGAVGHDFYEGKREGAKGFPRFTDPRLRSEAAFGDYLKMATEKSLERLGVDRFDVLMLHNPDRIGYTSGAVWDGLSAVREAGLADRLGIAPGPANGFTLDVIGAFERFADRIDWAMIILNPFEPWPGGLCLPAAEKHGVKVLTRVVDYGGIFHGDVKPGHRFARNDHRAFRPAGWVEAGNEKLDAIRPIAERHGLGTLQLACAWNLAQPAVVSVVPTVIQEAGEGARPIEEKIDALAAVTEELADVLTAEEVAEIARVGDNKGCMPLKGGSRQFQGADQADQWTLTEDLELVARRWNLDPDRDLYCAHDPRDLRDQGMPRHGVPQLSDRRSYVQLHVFTEASAELTGEAIEAIEDSGIDAVVYANVNDPRGIGVLVMTEDPEVLAGKARVLLGNDPFTEMEALPDMTMVGRTYGFGREVDLEHFLTQRVIDQATNPDWPWAVWYPLRRKGAFYALSKEEQTEILKEHGMIGFQFGSAGYAGDIRLACFGLDEQDNEFLLGLMGPRLDWLSKLVEKMRPTVQTSQYMDSLGPFFVGRVLYRSGDPKGDG